MRIEIARYTRWQRQAGPGFRVTTPEDFSELERTQEASLTAERAGRRILGMNDATPSAISLKQCIDAWVDDRKADKDPYDDGYLSDVRTRFRRFMAVVGMGDNPTRRLEKVTAADIARGNVQLHQLKAQHFANFRLWTSHQPGLGSKALNDHMLAVGTVFRYVDETRPDWQIPAQLLAWATKYLKKDKYAPAEQNALPTDVHVFRRLFDKAEQWASTPMPTVAKRTRRENPLFLRAEQRRRQGVVMRAVLLFKLNVAGDNVDLCRLCPDQLKDLDGPLPWVDLPRPKMRRKLGKPIPRRTPLLPSTVAALKCLRELRPDPDHVFVGEDGPFTSGGLSQAYRELADTAGVKIFTLKHLRNAGPTIATRRGIASYLVDALLGHVLPTTAKFYVGWQTFAAGDLVPVVNAIGEEYLGEVVGGSGLGQA